MGEMLVCVVYLAVCHFRQQTSVSDGQCCSDNAVKTFLTLIAKLDNDCDESMLKRHLLTPEQLTERAKDDFELGLNKLEQHARQKLHALSQQWYSEPHM